MLSYVLFSVCGVIWDCLDIAGERKNTYLKIYSLNTCLLLEDSEIGVYGHWNSPTLRPDFGQYPFIRLGTGPGLISLAYSSRIFFNCEIAQHLSNRIFRKLFGFAKFWRNTSKICLLEFQNCGVFFLNHCFRTIHSKVHSIFFNESSFEFKFV